MTKKLTSEQWEDISDKIQLYNTPITTIANEYNISRQSIFLYFKRHSWEMKPKKLTFKQKIKKIWNTIKH